MIRRIYRAIRRRFIKIGRKFKKIVPVYVPVMQDELLKGRCALITGGTSGIGYAIAKRFLCMGADVIITGRNKECVQEKAVELRKEEGVKGNVFALQMDNTELDKIDAKFEEALELVKDTKIDILVNNAGTMSSNGFGKITANDLESVLSTNLKSAVLLSQCAAKYMKKNNIEGNILNVCSSSSLRPAITPYNLSKWGLNGFTLGLAKTLIQYGIVVNAIAPGPTATPFLIKDGYDGLELSSLPNGRYSTAEEIAGMSAILVSNMARTCVGTTVYMTGGGRNCHVRRRAVRNVGIISQKNSSLFSLLHNREAA